MADITDANPADPLPPDPMAGRNLPPPNDKPTNRTGSRSPHGRLTKRSLNEFLQAVQRHNPVSVACALAGFNKSSVSRWQAKGREAQAQERNNERLPEAEQVPLTKKQALCIALLRGLRLARARGHDRLVKCVEDQADLDYRAALAILGKRYPHHGWGERKKAPAADAGPAPADPGGKPPTDAGAVRVYLPPVAPLPGEDGEEAGSGI